MKIEGLSIIYADHKVVCNANGNWGDDWTREYVQMMSEELSPNGSIREHAAELRAVNNDGTWGIKKL